MPKRNPRDQPAIPRAQKADQTESWRCRSGKCFWRSGSLSPHRLRQNPYSSILELFGVETNHRSHYKRTDGEVPSMNAETIDAFIVRETPDVPGNAHHVGSTSVRAHCDLIHRFSHGSKRAEHPFSARCLYGLQRPILRPFHTDEKMASCLADRRNE